MRKNFFAALLAICCCFCLTSCFTYEFTVGNGASTGLEKTGKNHYLINGLVPLGQTDPADLAAGATDYDIKIEHTFIDGLISAITFGIYSPTTTTVTR